jgi:hypothetical protein
LKGKTELVAISIPDVIRQVKSYSDFESHTRSHVRETHEDEKSRKKEQSYLDNEVDYEAWYTQQKDDILTTNHEKYYIFRDQLQDAESYLDTLLENANATLSTLSALSDSFRAVEAQTTEFQDQCEGILADQKRTSTLAENVAENLQYYNYLEPITKRLNAPGAQNLVRRSEFPEILANLDSCLEYLGNHPKQKEAHAYASKYRLLLTRSLTLIRNYFSTTIKDVAQDVTKRVADRQLNDTTMSALLYAKFRVGAPEMKKLGQEIQKRAIVPAGAAPGTEAEYQGLMNELFQTYSAARARLLLPIINKKMSDIAAAPSTGKDLVAFARSSINFVRGICADEHQLWAEWFDSENMLYTFLESLCDPLYNHLRPRIIKEPKLLSICELCTLIQSRYMEDSESEDVSESEAPELDFAHLIQPAIQDAQGRLVFLAQATIRNEIEYFKPKPDQLDYPRRASRVALSGSKTAATIKSTNGMPNNPVVLEDDTPDREFLFEPGTGEYYPTLRKAVWLLSRIYHLVQVRLLHKPSLASLTPVLVNSI